MTLVSLTELAQDELEAWELSAMRDPRNWVRPAAAAVVGASAGTALVVLRVRARHRVRKQRSTSAGRAGRADAARTSPKRRGGSSWPTASPPAARVRRAR